MRYLVISDMHANVHALDAVIADATAAGFDAALVLGDLVGYGADPALVIERTLALAPAAIVRGNHDKVAAGLAPAADFHEHARVAIDWTRRALSPAELASLAELPQGPVTISDDIQICHGAPFDEDHYIFETRDAWRALRASTRPLCLFGHTHVPAAFSLTEYGVSVLMPEEEAGPGHELVLEWNRQHKLLVNVGAVGQPRDGDPRAAYGIVDTTTSTIHFRRVEYDIEAAQQRILAAGLPERLARRLDRGA
jgi:diadenosine tetraphosphatase ApaH/serine/threonine PP2A family protein phosphatase